jgi:tRNA threonylcarbamoyladenosine biosynthesis protein TsaB
MPEIAEMLEKAGIGPGNLDLIVISRGPGSFTGLRIGMAAAKGLSAGTGVPLVSVPTLDVLAYGRGTASVPVMAVIDARKGRFYCAVYRSGERLSDYLDISAEETALLPLRAAGGASGELLLTGPGVDALLSQISKPDLWHIDPLRRSGCGFSLASCGKRFYNSAGADSDNTGPLYLRKSEAELSRGE